MQELSEQQLQVSNREDIEGVTEKYLQPILEVLDRKNIQGARLLKQGNKGMLLIDKSQLNSMNMKIMNTMNMVYPNHVVCINNLGNPFDYEELYEDNLSKENRKVRPYQVFERYWSTDETSYNEYYEAYSFSGIELDTRKLDPIMQLGYFLEFVNALQIQNPLEQGNIEVKKGVEVYSPEILRRYDDYIKKGCPDKQPLVIIVEYNEDIQDDKSKGLELKGDPYFNRVAIISFNVESKNRLVLNMQLSQSRMETNVKNYIASKQKKSKNGHRIEGDNTLKLSETQEETKTPSVSEAPEL